MPGKLFTIALKALAFCTIALGTSAALAQVPDVSEVPPELVKSETPAGPWATTYVLNSVDADNTVVGYSISYIELNEDETTKVIVKRGEELIILEGSYEMSAEQVVLSIESQSLVAYNSKQKVISDPGILKELSSTQYSFKVRGGKFDEHGRPRDLKDQPIANNTAILEVEVQEENGSKEKQARYASAFDTDVTAIILNGDKDNKFSPPTATVVDTTRKP